MTSVLSSIEGSEEFYQPLVNDLSEFPLDIKEKMIKMVHWSHVGASLFFLALLLASSVMEMDATISPIVLEVRACDNFCDNSIQDLTRFNFRFVIPMIAAVACTGHLTCLLVFFYHQDFAEKWLLAIGAHPVRWIEYSLTYALTTMIAAVLVGVMDVLSWFLLFSLTALGMGLWQLVELLPRLDRPDLWPVSFHALRRLCFALGLCGVLVPWVVIFCYYTRMVSDDTPRFISVAVMGLFALYASLALNVLLGSVYYAYGFCNAEMLFITISVATKLFLTVTLYVGLA